MIKKGMSKYLLPRGATLLPEVLKLKLGNWSPMKYDAEMVKCGIRWFRVWGGMGGRFDREDWVADLPGLSVSVHDYQWNGESFGANYGTLDSACYEELKRGLWRATEKKKEVERKLDELVATIELLQGKLD